MVQQSSHGQYYMVFAFLMAFWGDQRLKEFLQGVLQQPVSSSDFEAKALKLINALISQGIARGKGGRVLLINLVYESQLPSLADPVYKVLVEGDWKLDMSKSNLTAIECRGLAFLLTHSTTKPTCIE